MLPSVHIQAFVTLSSNHRTLCRSSSLDVVPGIHPNRPPAGCLVIPTPRRAECAASCPRFSLCMRRGQMRGAAFKFQVATYLPSAWRDRALRGKAVVSLWRWAGRVRGKGRCLRPGSSKSSNVMTTVETWTSVQYTNQHCAGTRRGDTQLSTVSSLAARECVLGEARPAAGVW